MKARDVMTDAVVSVHPDTTACQIARLLLDNGISAVPVVDSDGAPVGMVSEGDLIGRDEAARVARRDWWLALLAEGETAQCRVSGKPARLRSGRRATSCRRRSSQWARKRRSTR